MLYNWLAFVALSIGALVVAGAINARTNNPWPQRLVLTAVALRIVGAILRYEVLFNFYKGIGDATGYYGKGLTLAAMIRSFEMLPLTTAFWSGEGTWWGTSFVIKVSGLVLTVIGPTMRGEFLIFSLMAFGGLVAIAAAFRNVQPGRRSLIYASWIWIWPSLWFWPSSVGKEAVLMMAIGVTTLGYAGKHGRVRWPLIVVGLFLAFCIRPHVAAVLGMSIVAAHWLGTWDRATFRRFVEASVALVLGLAILSTMADQLGFDPLDTEGVQQFIQTRAHHTLQGGSSIDAVPLSGGGVPLAFVNIWMRPFVWEAHNATSLFAALELLAFWLLIWLRWRAILVAFKHWRKHRLLRFAVPFILAYTLMIGLTFGNLGLIARQRAPIFPFMFMIVLAAPDPRAASGRKGDAPRRAAVARAKAA